MSKDNNFVELIFPDWFDSKYFIRTALIDNCLIEEIKDLWNKGIQTTSCCSGHDKERGYIVVIPEHIKKMEELGYEHFCDPEFKPARTHFKPKTK